MTPFVRERHRLIELTGAKPSDDTAEVYRQAADLIEALNARLIQVTSERDTASAMIGAS